MIEIDSSFIGDFKLGDNVNFNLKLLNALYVARAATTNGIHKRALCKPLTVTLISIIEALLHDLHFKAKAFTREKVPGLLDIVLEYIQSKKLDKMEHLVVSARKHDLLQAEDSFYDELDHLRQVRNRIHIQNQPPRLADDEHHVFTPEMVVRAERALEQIMKMMSATYRRPDHAGYVAPFVLPWNDHLTC